MNRIKRRIIAAVLAAVLSFTASPITYAAGDSIIDESILSKMEILRQFNIIGDYYDYNTDVNAKVTRAQFADAVYRIIEENKNEYETQYYYDVPKTYWAFEAVTGLTEKGIVGGYSEKKFNPDSTILVEEACKILVSVLGYDDYAEANGGYPAGYLRTASRLGLTSGTESAELSLGNMFVILANALDVNMFTPYIFGDSVTYTTENAETLLACYRKVYIAEGTITAAAGISLSDMLVESSDVFIDDEKYTTALELEDYIGLSVKAYYKQVKKSDEKEVLYIENNARNEYEDIVVSYDASFDEENYVLEYTSADGTRKVKRKLNRNIIVVYNGRVTNGNISNIFKQPKYKLRLIKGDDGYYAAIVWCSENIVVSQLDSKNATAYGTADMTKAVVLNAGKYDYFKMTLDGVEITVDDIQAGYVISCFMSENKEYLKALVSSVTATGIVEAVSENSYEKIITLNSRQYKMEKNGVSKSIYAGQNVTLYINYEGEAVYFKENSSGVIPAYLMNVAVETVLDTRARVKLLLNSGTVETKTLSEPVKIDGERCEAKEAVNALKSNGKVKQQLVMISYNKAGEIDYIDTVKQGATEDSSNLSVNVPEIQAAVFKNAGSNVIGGMSVYDANTIFFSVPADAKIDEADDNDYKVLKYTNFENDQFMTIETYKTAEKIGIEKLAVVKGYDFSKLNYDDPILITEMKEGLSAEGEMVKILCGYRDTVYTELQFDEDCPAYSDEAELRQGVFVRVKLNTEGLISNLDVIYDPDNPSRFPNTPTDFNGTYRVASGYVNDVVDGVIKIGYTNGAVVDQVLPLGRYSFVIVDKENERNPVTVGSSSEIRTYLTSGNDCSKMVFVTNWLVPFMYVVYR